MGRVVKKQSSLSLLKCEVGAKSVAYLSGGEGPPLLFIHGWAVTPYAYGDALSLAAHSGHRIIAPFLPGFGPSESLDAAWPSSLKVSEWIESFLEESGEERPVVVAGHSLGGGFAASYVANFPEKIERLFLLSSVGGHVGNGQGLIQSRSALEWSISLPVDLLASQMAYGSLASIVGTGLFQLIRDPIWLWKLSRVARSYRLFGDLERVVDAGTKVYVVGASSDRVITKDAVTQLAGYASVEPIWVPGTHSWISTHPESFVEILTSCC